ncbi:hypothetical protein [Taibaiella soli]|uniref:Uncharacterized protein n=1 Tax=Taibaiella soli TaxID=1649169 RepID=A0A2W2BES5_9BACT|nr:hypothetical protein [Taibaiella soli]PZF74779.1 hypothetical protein DN068_00865 [Taibaiella soli]
MKKSFLALLFAPFLLTACSDKQKELSETEVKAKVDSLVGVKMEELNRQSMEDLDRRLSIEVKAKADSILAARMNRVPVDTSAKALTTVTTTTTTVSDSGTHTKVEKKIIPNKEP